MTLHRVWALRCEGCGTHVYDDERRARGKPTPDGFRRYTRRRGWRRLAHRDLCAPCTTDQRVRDRISALPTGLF